MFHESPRFPEAISKGAKGGPSFSTEIVRLNSGKTRKNINWPDPVRKYDVSHGIRSQAEFDEILSFFLIVKGMGNEFRFKDWSDYQTSNGLVISGRLCKRYSAGDLHYDRVISKPVPGTVKIYLNGEMLQEHADYDLDYTSGAIAFHIEPQGTLSWEGEYDVPAAFSTDIMQAVVESSNIYSWEGILIEEVRI